MHVPDPAARRAFGRYWLVVRPFSGLIRIALLRAVRGARNAGPATIGWTRRKELVIKLCDWYIARRKRKADERRLFERLRDDPDIWSSDPQRAISVAGKAIADEQSRMKPQDRWATRLRALWPRRIGR